MKNETTTPVESSNARSLTKVLGESEHIRGLVDECAVELASVNTALKEESRNPSASAGIEDALEKSEAVEDKVQDAADKLAVVNEAPEAM